MVWDFLVVRQALGEFLAKIKRRASEGKEGTSWNQQKQKTPSLAIQISLCVAQSFSWTAHKQGLREEDTAFLMIKGQLAKGNTVLPQKAALFVRYQQPNTCIKIALAFSQFIQSQKAVILVWVAWGFFPLSFLLMNPVVKSYSTHVVRDHFHSRNPDTTSSLPAL